MTYSFLLGYKNNDVLLLTWLYKNDVLLLTWLYYE